MTEEERERAWITYDEKGRWPNPLDMPTMESRLLCAVIEQAAFLAGLAAAQEGMVSPAQAIRVYLGMHRDSMDPAVVSALQDVADSAISLNKEEEL